MTGSWVKFQGRVNGILKFIGLYKYMLKNEMEHTIGCVVCDKFLTTLASFYEILARLLLKRALKNRYIDFLFKNEYISFETF